LLGPRPEDAVTHSRRRRTRRRDAAWPLGRTTAGWPRPTRRGSGRRRVTARWVSEARPERRLFGGRKRGRNRHRGGADLPLATARHARHATRNCVIRRTSFSPPPTSPTAGPRRRAARRRALSTNPQV